MCNLSKGVEEKGIEIGTLRAIQNLMETLKLTAEQAMAALKVPDSEQEKYAGMLKKQKQDNSKVMYMSFGKMQ